MGNWANLDNETIETLLAGINDIDQLGTIIVVPEVGYPINRNDIVEAISYILERDLIGLSFDHFDACKAREVSGLGFKYIIPIADRSIDGRTTPRILLNIGFDDNGLLHGRLYHTYKEESDILNLMGIPRPSK